MEVGRVRRSWDPLLVLASGSFGPGVGASFVADRVPRIFRPMPAGMGVFVDPEPWVPMLLLLKKGVSETAAAEVATRLRMFGLAVHRTDHEGRVRLAGVGDGVPVDWDLVRRWPEIDSVERIPVPFKLVSRCFHPQPTLISLGRCAIGSDQLAIMAG